MKNLIMLAIMMVGSYSFAQQALNISKSTVFKDDKKHTELVLSEGDGNGGVLTVRMYYGGLLRAPKGYYIEHFDKSLNLISSTEIEIEKSMIEGAMIKDGNVYLFQKQWGDDLFSINVLSSPLSKLKFESKELLSFDEDDMKKYFAVSIGIFGFNNGLAQADEDFLGKLTFSKEKNFFAFNFDIKDKKNEVHRIFVFNDAFEKVYENDFTKAIKDRYFEFDDISVDDENGNVYMLGKEFENDSRRTKKKGKINYHYELIKLSPEGETSISFKTEEHFVASLTTLKANSHLSCVGFYSDRSENRYKGVVRFDIDPETMRMKNTSFQPFTKQFIIDKYGKEKQKELRSLRYRGVFMEANTGDIIVNAEEYFVRTHYNGRTGAHTTTYHFNDIVSTKIGADGNLIWARNINKRQAANAPYFNTESYTSTYHNGKVYIFLNGSKKVKKIRNDRIEFRDKRAKKLNLYSLVIDAKGNFDYEIIQTDKQLEFPMYVSQGTIMDDGAAVVFLGRKKRNKQLIKINI
ncbi:hypothetical protein MG296_04225 [Flavobacteriaceae bacterium TK19130]|nr:hypothetical protein [Thermobacterium salinum]